MLKTGTADGSALIDLGGPSVSKKSESSASGFADALDGQMKRMNRPESGSSSHKAEDPKPAEKRSEDAAREPVENGKKKAADEKNPNDDSTSAQSRESDGPESKETTEADSPAFAEGETADGWRPESVTLVNDSEIGKGDSDADPAERAAGKGLPPEPGKDLPPVLLTGTERTRAAENQSKTTEAGRQTSVSVQASTRAEQLQLRDVEGQPKVRLSDVLAEKSADSKEKVAEGVRPSLENGKGSDKFFELLTAGRNALTARNGAAADLAGAGRNGTEAAANGFGRESSVTVATPGTVGGSAPQPVQSASASIPTTNVNVPVQQPGWDQALGDKVVWMTRQNLNQAQVQLNPRHLGPIELKVAVNNDQVNVQFHVQNPVTREAVEAAMPRLREMLSDSGLNLAQSDVSDHPKGGQGDFDGDGEGADARGAGPFAEHTDGEEADGSLVRETALGDLGVVDYFA